MAPKIERSMLIGELVMNYPQSVEVLYKHGFHCIGCGLSAYETLEEGCQVHGFDDAAIEQVIEEIKEAVKAAEEIEKKKAEAAANDNNKAKEKKEKKK